MPTRTAHVARLRQAEITPVRRGLLAPVLVQAPVVAAQREELLVRALLDDPAVLEHDDLAGALDRGEAVGDDDSGAARQQAPQAGLDA